MSRKNIIIIGTVLLIIVIALGAWFIWRKTNQEAVTAPSSGSTGGSLNRLEFMTSEEKAGFELPEDTRVQVISRDGDGQVSVYKIIKSEEDIVPDPSQLPPISPSSRER